MDENNKKDNQFNEVISMKDAEPMAEIKDTENKVTERGDMIFDSSSSECSATKEPSLQDAFLRYKKQRQVSAHSHLSI